MTQRAFQLIVSLLPVIATTGIAETFGDLDAAERVANGAVMGQSQMTVVGEIRTVDEVANPRLWGKGRPNTQRYGTSGIESGLCTAGTIEYGLSHSITDWGSAADACPVGTWVCTKDELQSGGEPFTNCDTVRPDSTADYLTCSGGFVDHPEDSHIGWLAGSSTSSTVHAFTVSEYWGVGLIFENLTCGSIPVWCCSEASP